MAGPSTPFLRLDFIYCPSADVARDVRYFTEVLGAQLAFAIEAHGTRVAMVRLSETPPALLLAGHLTGEEPIFIYRVESLDEAIETLTAAGWEEQPRFEIPHGPCCEFRAPGGQRLALYEVTRPQVPESFEGRRDF